MSGVKQKQDRSHAAYGFMGLLATVLLAGLGTAYVIISQHPLAQWIIMMLSDSSGHYMFSHLVMGVFVAVLTIVSPIFIITLLVITNR